MNNPYKKIILNSFTKGMIARLIWWILFNRKKALQFAKKLDIGMSANSAYNDVKNNNNLI